MDEIERVRKKFVALSPALTERTRRLWAGSEAEALGRGGVAWVASATGMAISTVRKGRDELRQGTVLEGRQRRLGGGRRRLEVSDPKLSVMLDALVNPTTRGDPESPLRWTCKSLRALARELSAANHPVGADKVGQLLHAAGYSLQANAKKKEGTAHVDRDAQFDFINARATTCISRGVPVISVDAKKKEAIGQRANPGREWQPRGTPEEVIMHDLFDAPNAPKAIPYGIYDIAENTGFINVGTDNNTPTFAVRSIEKWWQQMGSERYPAAKELFITADAGGSNAARSHVWKVELQKLADKTGLTIHVSHFPPGTSKWNKIEHRLFSFVSLNWRGRPLATHEIVVALIGATTTSTGLKVAAELDLEKYPLGISAVPLEMQRLRLNRAQFHGDWNYTLHPRSSEELATLAAAKPAERRLVTHVETKAKWTKLIHEQLLSGMNNRDFCRQRGIQYDTFMSARRRIVGKIQHHRRRPK